MASNGLAAVSAWLPLVNHGVDEKSKPEALKKVKDQAFGCVEKAQANDVPIAPICKRSDENRPLAVHSPPPASPLYAISGEARRDAWSLVRRRLEHFGGLHARPSRVPHGPSHQRRRDNILIVVFEAFNRAVRNEVLIVSTGLAAPATLPKKTE